MIENMPNSEVVIVMINQHGSTSTGIVFCEFESLDLPSSSVEEYSLERQAKLTEDHFDFPSSAKREQLH